VSERGEEAGEQSLDSMDKNCVRRRRAPGELATDSEVPRGSRRLYIDAARVRRKLSHLIRGGLPFLRGGQKSAEAVVVGGWGSVHPWRSGEPGYRAKGRAVKELSGKAKGDGWTVEIWQDQTGRGSDAEGAR